MFGKLRTMGFKKIFLGFCFITAVLGLSAFMLFKPTVVKLPSAPANVLTAEEYRMAEAYCKQNTLEVEASTYNKWIFAVACKRADGLLLLIPKTKITITEQSAMEKTATVKMETVLSVSAPLVAPPMVSGVSEAKPHP